MIASIGYRDREFESRSHYHDKLSFNISFIIVGGPTTVRHLTMVYPWDTYDARLISRPSREPLLPSDSLQSRRGRTAQSIPVPDVVKGCRRRQAQRRMAERLG